MVTSDEKNRCPQLCPSYEKIQCVRKMPFLFCLNLHNNQEKYHAEKTGIVLPDLQDVTHTDD